MATSDQIDAVRQFNRFHTRVVGALGEHLLQSALSLPQARVLYEIAKAPRAAAPSARELGRLLHMDTGYLSRLLAALERDGLVCRQAAGGNARRLQLSLTDQGRQAFDRLDAAAADEVRGLLAPLSGPDIRALVAAMACIRRLLGDVPADRSVTLREPEPGDIGWIVHRQGRLYAQEYGWDLRFEALVAEISAQFVRDFKPGAERCWVADRGGDVVGSVFVVRQDDETAKLRLLYVEPSARGLGLGRRLVDECLRFAAAKGYRRMQLWTNDVLVAARRIYETAGFQLIEQAPHHSFGKDLIGQVWERRL